MFHGVIEWVRWTIAPLMAFDRAELIKRLHLNSHTPSSLCSPTHPHTHPHPSAPPPHTHPLIPLLPPPPAHQRAFIVTDKYLYDSGLAEKVTRVLDSINVHHRIFSRVPPDPTLAAIRDGMDDVNEYKPDVIIALGGGSPMDAAKVRPGGWGGGADWSGCGRVEVQMSSDRPDGASSYADPPSTPHKHTHPHTSANIYPHPPPTHTQIMWLLYEQPDTRFESVAMRFMDITKRVYDLPKLGKKAEMVCIPTTSGTGSEVTPFSVVTDEVRGWGVRGCKEGGWDPRPWV